MSDGDPKTPTPLRIGRRKDLARLFGRSLGWVSENRDRIPGRLAIPGQPAWNLDEVERWAAESGAHHE